MTFFFNHNSVELELFLALLLGASNNWQHLPRTPRRYWSSQGCCRCQHCNYASSDPTCWSTHVPCCADVPHAEDAAPYRGWTHRPASQAMPTILGSHTCRAPRSRAKWEAHLRNENHCVWSAAFPPVNVFSEGSSKLKIFIRSVREEPCNLKCFQPWGKGPEEPVFLHLKKAVRASLNTGIGNASAGRDETIPWGAVFLLLNPFVFHICEHGRFGRSDRCVTQLF